MKSNSVMTCEVAGTVIGWTFKDGKKLSFDCAKASAAVAALATVHGFKQKIGDAAAISVVEGKPATIETKRAAMEKVIANLNAGDWSGPREGGGAGVLMQALIVVYPKKTREQLDAYVKPLSATERLVIANSPKVAAAIATIEKARIAGIDNKELLAGLDAA